MIQNYVQLVERIAKSSGLSVEDINRRVEAKRAKLAGLISKEGAAQVVAAELGISFEKEKMKLSELLEGMKKVNVVGKIIEMRPVVQFNKNGREGKVVNFFIADETSNTKVVLWDTNHIDLIEQEKIKDGDIVEISHANVRDSELHLTGFSDIKLSEEKIENIKTERVFHEVEVLGLKPNQNIAIRAVIVQMFEPKFFSVCPSCNKKVSETGECEKHGKVTAEKRALISLVLDDGTETIRGVMFSDQIEKIMTKEEIESSELFLKKRDELLGKEIIVAGQVRKNKLFDNLEIFVQDFKEIEVDDLIAKLETK
tara:strand:+ start:19 stop:954 length:936 start_codon:yes stop_codon:yes gene_type:complete